MLEIERQSKWLTVRQVAETYPCFTESSIRWLIFNEDSNNFAHCVHRIGRKIVINAGEFEKFIEQHQSGGQQQ